MRMGRKCLWAESGNDDDDDNEDDDDDDDDDDGDGYLLRIIQHCFHWVVNMAVH